MRCVHRAPGRADQHRKLPSTADSDTRLLRVGVVYDPQPTAGLAVIR